MRQVSQERLDAIAKEVLELLGGFEPFDFNKIEPPFSNKMELRLRELLATRHSYEVKELVCYLRACSSRSEYLPSWQPLLNSVIELGMLRGEPVWDTLNGLTPNPAPPRKNTG